MSGLRKQIEALQTRDAVRRFQLCQIPSERCRIAAHVYDVGRFDAHEAVGCHGIKSCARRIHDHEVGRQVFRQFVFHAPDNELSPFGRVAARFCNRLFIQLNAENALA